MNLEPVNLFATPDNWEKLNEWINAHREEERPHLTCAAMMAWNLACKLQHAPEPDNVDYESESGN